MEKKTSKDRKDGALDSVSLKSAPSTIISCFTPSRPNRDGTFKHWENSRTVVKTSCLLHRPVRPAVTIVTKACVCNYSLREPVFCCRFRSRTPGPPPFPSMNSTPADSNARRIAKSLALVSAVWFFFSSARRMVATLERRRRGKILRGPTNERTSRSDLKRWSRRRAATRC